MEADAVGAEFSQPVYGVDRVERRAHLGTEGVAARVPDGPEPEGEAIFWSGGEEIGHGTGIVTGGLLLLSVFGRNAASFSQRLRAWLPAGRPRRGQPSTAAALPPGSTPP